MKEIYWHLPGFTYFFYLNQVIIRMMKDHPDYFREGYRIGSVYGTFPGAIWNGGRAVFGMTTKGDMEKIISTYNRMGVPVRFTWTNYLIEEKHLTDTYCNLIMSIADNGMNQVLVSTDILENYLREHYPRFKYLSSTTKRITSLDALGEELKRDYMLVVLDYDLNHDEEALKALEPQADRIEILVDEICFPGCPRRKEHYREESLRQITFDKGDPFPCPNRTTMPGFAECMKRPAFIAADEVQDYVSRGFTNFKLVGRGLPVGMVKDSYMYYLVRKEYQQKARKLMDETLEKLSGAKKKG
ncbi:MAG: hypothetical protein II759_00085 [Lachnospiraceae bacterium]|nr:hypothetical protein [Lachnospiraceae bacterium]